MIEQLTYMILLLVFTGLPILYFWLRQYKFLIKFKKIFLYTLIGTSVISFFWDYIAVKDNVWIFHNILGIWILGLPLEEWLFFWFVSFAIVSVILGFIGSAKK
ncbi:MAG: lycopene cyclase domain-containing protein [Candidatus Aenigmarchaeota archaeon]|nr:lycopene cyclase domain-containing protein [Candidatus Aenigmarchaeota archaeon]